MSEEMKKIKALLQGDFDYCTKCDSSNCKVDHAKEEKRLQALAELQEDGVRMEKFDLDKKSWDEANKMGSLVDFGLTCLGADLYQKGFNKGAELERERILDLVMEVAKEEYGEEVLCFEHVISKLRGEK